MSLACVALALSSRSSGAAQRYEHPKAVVVAFVQGNCLSVRRDDNPKSVMRALLKSSTRILAYWRIEYQLLYTNDRMQEFTPLRSPWTMFFVCKYSRPSATSPILGRRIRRGTEPGGTDGTYKWFASYVGVGLQILNKIPVVHPGRHEADPSTGFI